MRVQQQAIPLLAPILTSMPGNRRELIERRLGLQPSWETSSVRHVRAGAGHVHEGRTRHLLHDRKCAERQLLAYGGARLCAPRLIRVASARSFCKAPTPAATCT